MGTWQYSDRALGTELPAVKNSFNRFTNLLTGPLCGWPQSSIIPVANAQHPGRVPDLLMTQFAAATDVALFYYVGHGLLSDDEDPQLCLGLTRTVKEPHRVAATSMLYGAVRRALLRSPARTKIVILDCCHSKLALPSTLGPAGAATADALPEELLDEAGWGSHARSTPGCVDRRPCRSNQGSSTLSTQPAGVTWPRTRFPMPTRRSTRSGKDLRLIRKGNGRLEQG